MLAVKGRFAAQITARAVLLFLTLLLLAWVLSSTAFRITPLALGLLAAGLLLELLAFVQRSNQEVARFLDHIEFDDVGQRMPAAVRGSGFDELSDSMARVIAHIGDRRRTAEADRRTLQAVIENVPSPLFSVRHDGVIGVHNHAARRFFAPASPATTDALGHWSPELFNAIQTQAPGESRVVRFTPGDEAPTRMALSLTDIVVGGQRQRLVALQNISSDLDARELEAWEEMARVLAHEIMNSLTPVASLAGTASDLLASRNAADLEKATEAIETVAQRADSLMEFVQAYRSFTRLPEPKMQKLPVQPLFERVRRLMAAEEAAQHVVWTLSTTPKNLALQADPDQLEQVLINLLRNAMLAVSDEAKPAIELSAHLNREGAVLIEVADNGPGVPQAKRDRIFVPYFSTRRGGSGIGLALSRQVMSAHGGSITVRDNEPKGARFQLRF